MELSQVQIQPPRTRAQKESWDAVPWDVLHVAAQLGQGWGRLGAAGQQEKAMPHTRASSPRFTAPAFSTYDSPCQELVPERSPFLQAEEDTPCKHKTQTPSQVPQTVGSQQQPRPPNSSQPTCPTLARPQTFQRGDLQATGDVLKPLPCPPPP